MEGSAYEEKILQLWFRRMNDIADKIKIEKYTWRK